jgi:hypothetical protein
VEIVENHGGFYMKVGVRATQANFGIFGLTCLFVVRAFAQETLIDDPVIREKFNEAVSFYAKRSLADPQPVDNALEILTDIEDRSPNDDLNYDILILESQALLWKGRHVGNRDFQYATHQLGEAKSEKAIKLKPLYAEGYYFTGMNLGRLADLDNLFDSIAKKDRIIWNFEGAMKRPARDGSPGITVDFYGPARALGRGLYLLPAMFGGSREEALKHLKRAYANASAVAINVTFYAEALSKGSSAEKSLAKQILDDLLTHDPLTYNLQRVPENVEDFELARKLRKDID